MAVKIKITKGGDDDEKKLSPQELAKQNQFAKTFAMRKIPAIGENAHVGPTGAPFIDAATGLPAAPAQTKLPPNTIMDIRNVPSYVKELSIDENNNVPYYKDASTGDIQYVHPDIFHSSRFNPNRGKSADMLIAKR